MDPREVIVAFDAYLAACGLRFEAVVTGGTALNLLGVVRRTTRDCDVLHPAIPGDVAKAARKFAAEHRTSGDVLQDDWLDNGPASLVSALPSGWLQWLTVVFEGKAILLNSLGRLDLLRSKLFGLCDRARDLGDCVALAPTREEIAVIAPSLEEQDGNPYWGEHVSEVLRDLEGRLGRGL